MDSIQLDAYLFFAGNAKEALEFYKKIFGGQLDLMTYDQSPSNDNPKMKGKVMHALLSGGDIRLMASDSPYPEQIATGKISISLSGVMNQNYATFMRSYVIAAK